MRSVSLLRSRCSGSTLLEATFATAIVAVFFSGLYAMNGRAMAILKQSVECTAATSALQQRVEQVRTATWAQITDTAYLRDTLLASPSSGAPYLGSLSEKITLNVYPEPAGYSAGTHVARVEVTRAANGTVTVTDTGDGTLASGNAIRVDFTATWGAGGSGAIQVREMSTFVSQGGMAGRNQ